MQFSAVLKIFIVKTYLNSTFTNDLKRKYFFSKNVHSNRVCSFKLPLRRYSRVSDLNIGKDQRKKHRPYYNSINLVSVEVAGGTLT